MRGSQFFPPKNFGANFWAQASLGDKALSAGKGPNSFPVKPSEIPVFRTSPSNGYNPSTNTRNALKSPRFSCPLPSDICDLHPHLLPFRPKYPIFSKNLDCVSAPPRDFRDQLCDFARLSCIEKGLPKNMARILRGVKSPLASSAGGGGVVWLCLALCLPFVCLPFIRGPSSGRLAPLLPCSLPAVCRSFVPAVSRGPSFPAIFSRGAWAFLEHGHF